MKQESGFFFYKTAGGTTAPTWRAKMLIWTMPIVFLGAGLVWLFTSYLWVANATETIGTVTKINPQITETADGPQTLFNPEFSFTWTDGTQTNAPLGLASPEFDFEIGTELTILFDPSQKDNVRFTGFVFNYFGAIIILTIGAMFALISLVLWFWIKAIAHKRDLKKD
ncbi:MAG: DUF3592 domain-containing protein [Rhodobacteraceae bacterium]|nr:DUF3592 domain-containing protein [Paracoccaceae bacterium]